MADENKKDDDDQKEEVSMDDLQKQINELEEKEIAENSNANAQTDDKDAKVQELNEALARAMADLQNFKRRTEEDKGKFVKFANAEMLKTLLPVIDNFDRASGHLPDDLKKNDWAKGIVHIHDDLMKTLEKLGVKKIKTVGEMLNPNFHEALMSGPGEKDKITEEFEPGYTLNGEIIKAAKVKVGDGTK